MLRFGYRNVKFSSEKKPLNGRSERFNIVDNRNRIDNRLLGKQMFYQLNYAHHIEFGDSERTRTFKDFTATDFKSVAFTFGQLPMLTLQPDREEKVLTPHGHMTVM